MKNLLLAAILALTILTLLLHSNAYSQIIPNAVNTTAINQTLKVVQIIPHQNFNPFQKFENQTHYYIPPVHLYNSSLFPQFKLQSLAKILQQPQVAVNSISNSPNIVANVNRPLIVHLNQGFSGLDATTACGGCSPPDVQVATGPNHVIEFVNLEGEIWTKQGASISTFPLSSFFNSGSNTLSDPKILFDSISGRWFASILDITTDSVLLAVSTTNDPTSTWNNYIIPFGSDCPDQPILGISDDKIVLSGNDFTSNCNDNGNDFGFVGAQYVILNKAQAVAGTTVSTQYSTPDPSKLSIHPVQSLSSTSTLYMVSTDQSSSNQIQLFSITGTAPSAVVSTVNLAIPQFQEPPQGVQPGTTFTIDPGDARILDAKWYQNKLWLSFNSGCTPTGDTQIRSCARIVQIDTSSQTIIQDMEQASSGYYYFYPALNLDSLGDLVVIFGYSTSTIYPSLAVTKQAYNDPANTLEAPIILVSGTVADTSGRYGDYFGAASDPSVAAVWIAGEYHTSVPWSTFIGSTTECLPPLSGDWTVSSSCTLPYSTTAPANVIVQSNSVLTIPNGDALNMDFHHYHLLVRSGSGVLIKAGGVISQTELTSASVAISNGASSTGGTCSATNCFDPNAVIISTGGTVTWTNDDSVGHTATSGHSTDNQTGTIFDSSLIRAGGTYTSPSLTTVGTYPYFCEVHPWMTGEITVR
ncbi:MAG: plastocyanin/azurin family copper-binding protein [Nitrosotalea sp.]